MDAVLRNAGRVEVVLPAIVYAKVLGEHPTLVDLGLIDRTVRSPDERLPDPRPGWERFFHREGGLWVLAGLVFEGVPATIVTVFSVEHPPL